MSELILSRRKLIGGLGLLIAAPAVVRAASLMRVKAEPLIATRYTVSFDTAANGLDYTTIWISSKGEIYKYTYTPQKIEWADINDPAVWLAARVNCGS